MKEKSNYKINACSLKGLRASNEDHSLITKFTTHNEMINLYGIFDGHGGQEISKFLSENIEFYFKNLNYKNKKELKKQIYDTFDRITKLLSEKYISAKAMGSTCLLAAIFNYNNKKTIKIINIGDSRAVAMKKNFFAEQLSLDHKPKSLLEKMRLEKMGGNIYKDMYGEVRINGLSVSKTIGDLDSKPYVSHKPDIFDYKLKRYNFLILGCDGVWDVLDNQEACEFVLNEIYFQNKIENALENKEKDNIALKLGKYALAKGSQDNISIIIVYF